MESVIADKWGINEVSVLEVPPFFSADVCYLNLLWHDWKLLCAQLFNSPTGVVGGRLDLFFSSLLLDTLDGKELSRGALFLSEEALLSAIGSCPQNLRIFLPASHRHPRASIDSSRDVSYDTIRRFQKLWKWLIWYPCTESLEFSGCH